MSAPTSSPPVRRKGWFALPLSIKIIIALVIGGLAGTLWGPEAAVLKPVSDVVLGFLKLLATPLILLAVMRALMQSNVGGRKAGKLLWILMSNTVVAILVGILVANVLQPGSHFKPDVATKVIDKKPYNLLDDLLTRIPTDIVSPLLKNEILGIIVLAVVFGLAFRKVKQSNDPSIQSGLSTIENLMNAIYAAVMVMLHWVFELVPIMVLAVVTRTVGEKGFHPFVTLLWFALAVISALLIMACFYLFRLRLQSWVRPVAFLRGAKDALAMAFSTASSAATLPVTFESATKSIGVSEENASLGIMVGGTFNHDGTALYEAMAALFISQFLGLNLGFEQQFTVVIMSVVASVGAAGIPEAGLVTMLAVFTAVKLPTEYIAFLLPLDWFLDRCRTTINVMGDLSSTCILDGKVRPVAIEMTSD